MQSVVIVCASGVIVKNVLPKKKEEECITKFKPMKISPYFILRLLWFLYLGLQPFFFLRQGSIIQLNHSDKQTNKLKAQTTTETLKERNIQIIHKSFNGFRIDLGRCVFSSTGKFMHLQVFCCSFKGQSFLSCSYEAVKKGQKGNCLRGNFLVVLGDPRFQHTLKIGGRHW